MRALRALEEIRGVNIPTPFFFVFTIPKRFDHGALQLYQTQVERFKEGLEGLIGA